MKQQLDAQTPPRRDGETDFPHPTCLYPDPLAHARDNMRELSPTTRDKILSGNATKLYYL
jgi:hypothetical protein